MKPTKSNLFYLSLFTILILLQATILTGCSENFKAFPAQYIEQSSSGVVTNPEIEMGDKVKFCSPVSFSDVVWKDSMNIYERRAFAIALSMTGSFEGHDSWATLSNNFDGQGLSAGLLNQTLGTESLQPLLSSMLTNHQPAFSSAFSRANYNSIVSMINDWRRTALRPSNFNGVSVESSDSEMPDQFYGPSDIEFDNQLKAFSAASVASVTWAKNNLYLANKNFKSDWKAQLTALLLKPAYINLQVSAAEKYHRKAIAYANRVGMLDLRTYLLMFDYVTQNGSIKESRFVQWENYVRAIKITDRVKALKALVEIRLADTKIIYRKDVRSRKYTIIDGQGTVHGAKQNLPVAFCYQPTDPINAPVINPKP